MYPDGLNILVVDNDANRRELVARILGQEGFAVKAAPEGLSAVRAAGRQRFALIVAACALPGCLDGANTVRQLRVRQPGVKALFIADAARRPSWSRHEDCDEFIAAPFQRRELLGCVFELLQRSALPGAELLRRSRLALPA
jgi:DNA-binding response OmpR family regulator